MSADELRRVVELLKAAAFAVANGEDMTHSLVTAWPVVLTFKV
jgi:hypothetical protein